MFNEKTELPIDGRPFTLTDEEIAFMKEYIAHFVIPPQKNEIHNLTLV